jgi:hypothetical protein
MPADQVSHDGRCRRTKEKTSDGGLLYPPLLAEEEKEEEDDGDGTLVDTPTRCSNTKNSLDDRVRMSSAILTAVAAGGSVGLVAPRAARLRRVESRGEG